MDKLVRTDDCVTIGGSKINRLLFVDDLVLLASSHSDHQHASNGFAVTANRPLRKPRNFRNLNLTTTETVHKIFIITNLLSSTNYEYSIYTGTLESFTFSLYSRNLEGKTTISRIVYTVSPVLKHHRKIETR